MATQKEATLRLYTALNAPAKAGRVWVQYERKTIDAALDVLKQLMVAQGYEFRPADAMRIKLTIDECLEFADEWARGCTFHEGSQGWRVVCMLLAEEVRRLRGAQNTEALPQDWKGVDGAIAFHLIDRHADGWADTGRMMGEWLDANKTANAKTVGPDAALSRQVPHE